MEDRGIIRRIDDLGRIVIPREYRKLYGIDLGDPMEIRALGSGDILIKKVNTADDLIKNANKVVRAMAEHIRGTVLVCDFERWVVGYGERTSEFVGSKIGKDARRFLQNRQSYLGSSMDAEEMGEGQFLLFVPAHGGGDCYGGVCALFSAEASDDELTLVRLCARIMGEYMQKY
ncbi:MAG: hypothetical protein J6B79_04135 [Clostridia bacterium]|nr:hypothetical protein [Clostridia bacterium]